MADNDIYISAEEIEQKLDNLEALGPVFSNEKECANYYLWQDENPNQDSRIGYFVSVHTDRDSRTITLCDGTEIFGVTVETAGFIGGRTDPVYTICKACGHITQYTKLACPNCGDTNIHYIKDYKYGLVAQSGVVNVICEPSVSPNDYVMSNEYGIAAKSTSGYGYKVITTNDIYGIKYASISLSISANQADSLGERVIKLDNRVDAVTANAVAAMNVANEAYNKANECIVSNQEMSNKVNNALGTVDQIVTDVENIERQVENALVISAQARAIAESAATSAESMRTEAVDAANNALQEVSNMRDDLKVTVDELHTDMDNATLEIQGVAEQMETSIKSIEEDLEPLDTWTDGTRTGIAGFVARANEDSTTIGSLVELSGEFESLAAFKQEVADTYATIESLTLFEEETNKAIVGVKQTADANKAELDAVAEYAHTKDWLPRNTQGGKTLNGITYTVLNDGSIVANGTATDRSTYNLLDGSEPVIPGGVVFTVSGCPSGGSSTTYSIVVVPHDTYAAKRDVGEGLTIEATATTYTVYIEIKAGVVADNLVFKPSITSVESQGMAGLVAQVEADKSSLSALADYRYEDENGNIIGGSAGLIAQVDNNTSELELLAEFEQGDNKGIAGLKAQVSADASELLNIASHTYTDGNGNELEGLAAIDQQVTDQGATITHLTSWEGTTNTSMALIKQKADANGASIQLLAANIDKYSVGEYSQAYGFTLEQARDVLEIGTVYVPTPHGVDKSHIEKYEYTEVDSGKTVVKEKEYEFTPGYIYTWTDVDDSEETETLLWQESADKVVFFGTAPDALPFWYADSDDVEDGYEPYTLYKLETYTDEDNNVLERWVAVATLGGNSQNRAVSQIRQDTNSIIAEVTDAHGSVAGFGAWLTETESIAKMGALWVDSESGNTSMANIGLQANADGSAMSFVVRTRDGTDTVLSGASIILGDEQGSSYIALSADNIVLDGAFTANGNAGFTVDGGLFARSGEVAGWRITEGALSKGGVKLLTDDNIKYDSLANQEGESPIRLAIGCEVMTTVVEYEDIECQNGVILDYRAEFDKGEIESITIDDVAASDVNTQDIRIEVVIDDDRRNFTIKGRCEVPYTGWVYTELAITYISDVTKCNTMILDDGSLYASAAKITGTVYATDGVFNGTVTSNKGDIGGWSIATDGIYKGNTKLLTDDSVTDISLVDSSTSSPIRFAVGSKAHVGTVEQEYDSVRCEEGAIEYYHVDFNEGMITNVEVLDCVDDDGNDGVNYIINIAIDDDGHGFAITGDNTSVPYTGEVYVRVKITYESGQHAVEILDDGSLYASAAKIEGNFRITGGSINIGDKFIVDEQGNVQIKSGSIDEFGGRNYILNSNVEQKTSAYKVASYTPSEPLVAGEKYTISLCVTPAAGITKFAPHMSGGMGWQCNLVPNGTDKQILTTTFTARYYSGMTPEDNMANANINIYRLPNDGTVTGETTIHWIKVEKGSVATDWTPAPDDVNFAIENVESKLDLKADSATLGTYAKIMDLDGTNLISDSMIRSNTTGYGDFVRSTVIKLTSGKTYTFSVNGRTNANSDGAHLYVNIHDENWQLFNHGISIAEQEDTTKSVTFIAPQGVENYNVVVKAYYSDGSGSKVSSPSGSVTVNWYKLESGSVATAWSQAPEELFDAMATLETRVDENGAEIALKANINDVEAAIDLCVHHDADGNLTSAINIGADKLTIDTEYFKLDGSGNIIATSGQIGDFSLKDGILRFEEGIEFDNAVRLDANASGSYKFMQLAPTFFEMRQMIYANGSLTANKAFKISNSGDIHIVCRSDEPLMYATIGGAEYALYISTTTGEWKIERLGG